MPCFINSPISEDDNRHLTRPDLRLELGIVLARRLAAADTGQTLHDRQQHNDDDDKD